MFDNQFDSPWDIFLDEKTRYFGLTNCQSKVFITRFRQENWLSKIEDIWQLSDVNSPEAFVKHSTNFYKIIKPDCPLISPGAGNFPIVRDWLLAEFEEQKSTSQHSDLISTELNEECYQAIVQPGALIRIKAPSKMGKSSLLNNILAYSDRQEYSTVHLNLLQIESSKFNSLEQFLRWFCIYLSDALNLNLKLDDYWSSDRGNMLSCTRYLEAILEQLDQPLVLGLDEVDRLLNYPEISQDFFYLLRSWHEEANNNELWEKLRLIVVYSTEDFGGLDINQSPFNVGLPIELKPLERSQLSNLADSYGLNLSATQSDLLMTMLGGHIYLVDLMLANLANNSELSLDELLQQAISDTGIYSGYLRQHLINLRSCSQLTQVFREVLDSPKPLQVDSLVGYQLYRMGLIKWSENNSVVPSCELFRLYFLPRLMVD